MEALHASQSEGEGRLTGKGFESERARARQALREEVSAQRGQSVQKIAAASGEKDDGRILRVAAYCRVSRMTSTRSSPLSCRRTTTAT